MCFIFCRNEKIKCLDSILHFDWEKAVYMNPKVITKYSNDEGKNISRKCFL